MIRLITAPPGSGMFSLLPIKTIDNKINNLDKVMNLLQAAEERSAVPHLKQIIPVKGHGEAAAKRSKKFRRNYLRSLNG